MRILQEILYENPTWDPIWEWLYTIYNKFWLICETQKQCFCGNKNRSILRFMLLWSKLSVNYWQFTDWENWIKNQYSSTIIVQRITIYLILYIEALKFRYLSNWVLSYYNVLGTNEQTCRLSFCKYFVKKVFRM